MNKKTIITIMLTLVALAGQAKTFKTIKNPVAMACVNVSSGELKAREVIFRGDNRTFHNEVLQGTEFPICLIILSHGRGRQPLSPALMRRIETRLMGAVA